jgi:nitroreductase
MNLKRRTELVLLFYSALQHELPRLFYTFIILPEKGNMNPQQLKTIIEKRRSIFPNSYSKERVDDVIIEEMLENANWAPTFGKTEPWRFTVFTGEGLKKLADFQSKLYKEKSTAADNFEERKFNKLSNNPLKASHVIGIGMKRDPERKIKEIEEIEAVACAVQNMYLTAAVHQIGCYWGSGGVTYLEETKAFFDLEPEDKFLGFFYVGIPSIEWPEGNRGPISDKVSWVMENN